jgi:hypothetical protein
MLTKDDGRTLVVAELARPSKHGSSSDPADLVIIDENTIEKSWGWVFFYTSQRHLRTGEIRYALAGNAPYIVNRHTGEIRVSGTARPVEHYIEEYESELARR